MTTTPPDPPRVVAHCSACHHTGEPVLHCDTRRGCMWWVCGTCDAPNDGAGHWSIPKRHVGNRAGVRAWAAEFGITQDFTNTSKGKA